PIRPAGGAPRRAAAAWRATARRHPARQAEPHRDARGGGGPGGLGLRSGAGARADGDRTAAGRGTRRSLSRPTADRERSVDSEAARRRVLLGVTGGIAAYKTPELVRRLRDAGLEVHCALTPAARAFVSPLALEVVSGHPVYD